MALISRNKCVINSVLVYYIIWITIMLIVFLNYKISKKTRGHMEVAMETEDIGNPKYQVKLGENGTAVALPGNLTADQHKRISEGWKLHAFNQYVSDLISVHRSLKDPRDDWCKVPGRFLENLPATSIIICFHNEAWSTLLRTVHSVLDRSPKHLIFEIILVDDFSDMDHLKDQLDYYWSSESKVKIVRTHKREGLIRARLIGSTHAQGEVLTFLDSHCECSIGWLEPLLDRIARNRRSVVCPFIDVIDENSFKYRIYNSSELHVGGFDWLLQFNWNTVPENQQKRRKQFMSAPVRTPTMAGGLFSIDKSFFEWLGTYDSGFDIWGGENLELSFKTWMCGGTLEILPCSHVGHVFRTRSPYNWNEDVDVVRRNSIRLAEVWMDEYAKYYYQRTSFRKGYYGDIMQRRELRKKIHCKSFKWYVDNVYPDLFTPDSGLARGQIRNLGFGGNTCFTTDITDDFNDQPVQLVPCDKVRKYFAWAYTNIGEIRYDAACLKYDKKVILSYCNKKQLWKYNNDTKQLLPRGTNMCLALTETGDKLSIESCNPALDRQKWIIGNFGTSSL